MKRHAAMPRTRGFWSAEVQIDNDRILSVSHNYSLASLVWVGIDLLVRYVRWNVDKIARSGFFAELQLIAPSHSNSAFYHVKDGLQLSMMMRSGPGIWLNQHGAGPQLACSSARMRNCGGAGHARCLWRIQIKFIRVYDFDSMSRPVHK
jgi:hypothetical protein